MSVKNEFTKHAKDYNNNNIIQQIIAKALVREINNNPEYILELGCGSGQVFKNINWNIKKYNAIDFSSSMCKLHPRGKNIQIDCFDFDSQDFFDFLKDKHFDIVLSSSAMQWSKDLKKLVSKLKDCTNKIDAVLFTSNTFKTIQEITNTKSPILSSIEIKKAFEYSFNCEFEIYNYNLEFDDKKIMFDYIKNSGVSGGNSLSFKDAKKLYKEYKLNYLEFEVIFVKTISKS
ncbi:methyltransferase [Malaciobacter molluscorum LMG 25693]|uniref:Methyltransferase n=1 Tax=Malaciobacter molluscorum LMG 25693 TaxID=870501 RepID=A0A2G1DHW2_9BACT|nr:methyltransferase domain-containing protein [Malaciobacter molluscorum]AXX93653.1 SAM-dependent methyltransferase [Malaciobacter molluscorum LMG 25693]PHO17936.1 methyltransferase [Malaciobacter molluscorum LMG 25693]